MTSFSGDAFAERMKAAAAQRESYTTPVHTARKRTRHDLSSAAPSDDDRDEIPMNPLSILNTSRSATRNTATVVKSFAKKQKLRGEQLTQLDSFLNDTPTVREGKIFTLLLSLQNDVGNIIVAAPAFSVSPELKTNIQSYTHAVLLSPKLAQYRGDLPVQHVMNILKKHRFDMPPGIENNPADMHKITSAIQDAFTQCRSSCKKKLFASVRVMRVNESGAKVPFDLEPAQHQNLFALAQALVEGTKCRITNSLCGRIALMRDVYLQNSGAAFWTDLDRALGVMRTVANGNEDARDAMFEELILADKALHGAVDITYQVTNDVQQEVDDLIDAASADAASTPTSNDGPRLSEVANGLGDPPEGDNGVEDDMS
ncbi:hypothetical protein GGX14DRAFT_565175 [Mycena pura]|uniref:Uncharacterized protein n=1 Tax=Mycena pura TaxID=153505 RepID=A0AAD6YDX2_9AGAR|nr:hypothetical protein GGX14DRAFT_565175 [Mycena pura]